MDSFFPIEGFVQIFIYFISAIVIGTVLIFFYLVWETQRINRRLDKLGFPGPRPLIKYSNVFYFFTKGFLNVQPELIGKYGKAVGYAFGMCNGEAVMISDLDMLQEIMVKKFSYFRNRGYKFTNLAKPMNVTLANLNNERWKFVRSKLTPTFTTNRMKKMLPAIDQVLQNLEGHLKTTAETGKVVNLRRIARCIGMDSILRMAFQLDVDTLNHPDHHLSESARHMTGISGHVFLLAMTCPWVMQLLGALSTQNIMKEMNIFLDIVDKALKDRKESYEYHDDFLQLLLDAGKNGLANGHMNGHAQTETKTKVMTEDEMRANAWNLLFANFENISNVVGFTLFEFAAHPEILAKAQAEVDSVLGKERASYETANDLNYIGMCVNEALRLYMPGFIVNRTVMEDIEIGGYPLKKGMMVMVPLNYVHKNPETWPNPEKFDPERHTPEAKASRHPMAFMPFGMGPRQCTGTRWAILQMKIFVATAIQNHSPVLCESSVYPPKIQCPQAMMKAIDGLWVKIVPRK